FLWYGAFLVNLAGLSAFLPGDEVQGPRLRDGTRLTYTLNALTVLQTIVTLGILLVKNQGLHAPLWVADHDAHLAVASILAAAIVAGITYACSFHGQKLLSVSGNTGCPPYDWAVGRELSPRIGSFDLKLFAVRPGLIGWFVLIASYLLKQYHDLGHITNSMALVVGFQTLYIVDALWYETELLNSLAITHDGFGFIQAVVHFSWVPCVHSLQARYLADFPVTLPLWKAGLVAALNLGGYYMYRCRKPKKQQGGRRGSATDLSPRCIFAKYGKVTGDLMMSLSWSLACGCASAVPYFFVAYRAIALAYQEYRRVQHA
ncbi:ergosterol biosynthesis ERG4/ERG24 family-domain-containing protein, partial [Gongronella butleri]